MSRPGASYWHDTFPRSRRPTYPRHRGDLETDVVIVGGGLTGCACAVQLAAAGVRTVLLEADRVGGGATTGGAGVVREDFDAPFTAAVDSLGLRPSRAIWQLMRRASLDFASALRRSGIKCGLTPMDLLTVSPRADETVKRLRREYRARREAGLEHSWLTPAAAGRAAAVDVGAAIRTHGFGLDPYRACVGLAAAAAARRVTICEQSPVRTFRPSRKSIDVITAGGRIRATTAIVTTTGAPGLQALRRHLRPLQRYAVVTERLPAVVRREIGPRSAALRDGGAPPHLLRWLDGERALFVGAEQPPPPARAADKVLVQRTGQLMYELSTVYPPISGARAEWSWAASFDDTVDGLPFIGPHRNFPRQLFALGHGRHGEGVSWLAGRVLVRHVLQEPARGDEHLSFTRIL